MIRVEFDKEEASFISMSVEGHSGYAERGQDIVCSAASILAYTVGQTLVQMNKQGWLKEKPHIELNEGKGIIACAPKEEYFDECLMVFYVAEVGYMLLHNNYPQYVEIQTFGEPSEA